MNPIESYDLALKQGTKDNPRVMACQVPYDAYLYAREIDKCGRDDTRAAACQDPFDSYLYARKVDQGPRDDTREAACKNPWWAFCYARYVDQSLHPVPLQVILSIRLSLLRERLEFD